MIIAVGCCIEHEFLVGSSTPDKIVFDHCVVHTSTKKVLGIYHAKCRNSYIYIYMNDTLGLTDALEGLAYHAILLQKNKLHYPSSHPLQEQFHTLVRPSLVGSPSEAHARP